MIVAKSSPCGAEALPAIGPKLRAPVVIGHRLGSRVTAFCDLMDQIQAKTRIKIARRREMKRTDLILNILLTFRFNYHS